MEFSGVGPAPLPHPFHFPTVVKVEVFCVSGSFVLSTISLNPFPKFLFWDPKTQVPLRPRRLRASRSIPGGSFWFLSTKSWFQAKVLPVGPAGQVWEWPCVSSLGEVYSGNLAQRRETPGVFIHFIWCFPSILKNLTCVQRARGCFLKLEL